MLLERLDRGRPSEAVVGKADGNELSYASMNWIRFEGSPCRASPAPMASQPLAGAPLVSAGGTIVHGGAGVKTRTLDESGSVRTAIGRAIFARHTLPKRRQLDGHRLSVPGAPGDGVERLGPRFAVGVASAPSMARLSALATGLGGELRILREAALLVRDTLPALTAGGGGKLAILRETAFRAWNALSALSARLRRETPILREAPLLVRHRLTAHAGDLALPLGVHGSESPIGRTALRAASVVT